MPETLRRYREQQSVTIHGLLLHRRKDLVGRFLDALRGPRAQYADLA